MAAKMSLCPHIHPETKAPPPSFAIQPPALPSLQPASFKADNPNPSPTPDEIIFTPPNSTSESFALLRATSADLLTWTSSPLAVLLQIAHPTIARGTCVHSRVAKAPISRLLRTIVFITAICAGALSQQDTIIRAVKRQHARVRGKGYDARDAEAQKWTAATTFMSVIKCQRTFGRRMGKQEMEGLMSEFGRFAACLDMPWELWPESLEEMEVYFEKEAETFGIEIQDEGRRMGRVVLWGMELPWWLRWVMPVVRVVVANWLPDNLREAYGLADPNGWGMRMGYWLAVWAIWLVDLMTPGLARDLANAWLVRLMVRSVEGLEKTGRWVI
ncbi:hypothetical protein OQA88_4366 [Cercophora sp. LCS_1]